MTLRRTLAIGLLLALASCDAHADTPLFGAWQGSQPGADPDARTSIDLVLEGTPDAQSGQYRMATALHNPSARAGMGTTHWGGTWSSSQRVINGQTVTVVELNDALPSDISRYALMPDGTLRVLNANGTLDTSPIAALYTLSPVPPGPRRGRV
jgi:hypothetical protein